jgi:hypothetical protein
VLFLKIIRYALFDYLEQMRLFFREYLSFTPGMKEHDLLEQAIEVCFVQLIGCFNEFIKAHG